MGLHSYDNTIFTWENANMDYGLPVRCLRDETTLGADFEAEPTSGTAPLQVQFTDLSTGNPTSWQWDFQNDGTIDSEEQNPEYTYNEIGTYSVSLTVSDGINQDTVIKEDYILVVDACEISGIITAHFFLNDPITLYTVVGTALILIGVYIVQVHKNQKVQVPHG